MSPHTRFLFAAALGAVLSPAVALAAPDDPVEPPPVAIEAPVEIEERPVVRTLRPDHFDGDDNVVIDGEYDDVFGAGDTVELKGPVDDNAFLAGRELEITATVGGDVFAAGEVITIDQPVSGDVFALGADVIVTPNASVGGDIYSMSRSLVLDGPVYGSVHAGAGRVELGSSVAGDVEVQVGQLIVTDGASIAGDLDYKAPTPTDGVDDIVDGAVTFTEQAEEEVTFVEEEEPTALEAVAGWAGWLVWDYLSKLIVGAVCLFLGGMGVTRVAETVRDKPAESLGYGFLTLIVVPPAALLCIATVIPMSLGFLGLLGLGVLMFLGQLVTARWIGEGIFRATRPELTPTGLGALAVGLVPVSILFNVPWISFLAVLTGSLIGMGAIVTTVLRRRGAAA